MKKQHWVDHMESLGWLFMPTGPEEWEWLLFDGDKVVARQGGALWRAQQAFADGGEN